MVYRMYYEMDLVLNKRYIASVTVLCTAYHDMDEEIW